MRVGVYARVSTTRQAQAQTIEQQLDRLRAAVVEHQWALDERHGDRDGGDRDDVDRDDGDRDAKLARPGLDCLRDHAALAELDLVVVTAPDRLARNYVHQVLLIDELGRHGLKVECLDRPMSQDPHDRLLLGDPRGGGCVGAHADRRADAARAPGQVAGWHAVALDHTAVGLPPGPRAAPECGRGLGWSRARRCWSRSCWLVPGARATVYRLAKRLTDLGVATPTGKPRWNAASVRASVRGILRNPAWTGRALTNRTRVVPARQRRSALLPVGPGQSHAPRPGEDWIAVAVPQIVAEETFA